MTQGVRRRGNMNGSSFMTYTERFDQVPLIKRASSSIGPQDEQMETDTKDGQKLDTNNSEKQFEPNIVMNIVNVEK